MTDWQQIADAGFAVPLELTWILSPPSWPGRWLIPTADPGWRALRHAGGLEREEQKAAER